MNTLTRFLQHNSQHVADAERHQDAIEVRLQTRLNREVVLDVLGAFALTLTVILLILANS